MTKILLKNQRGFKWFNNHNLSFKGYFKIGNTFFRSNNTSSMDVKIKEKDEFLSLLNDANGFFAIVNESERYIFAAVDRVRSTPLFYARKNGYFYLSDDAHWVREQVGDQWIDEISKTEFLLTGYVTGNNTLYPNVKQLQAGEYLVYDKQTGQLDTNHYFQFRHYDFYDNSVDELTQLLDQVHVDVFQRLIESLNGRTAVIPLSGGQDSRLIVLMLKRLGYENVICFSYGKEGNEESVISKKIADFLGYKWLFIPYTKEKWREWYKSKEKMLYFQYADGFSSLPHIQDILAVSGLKQKQLIPVDSIFIPGHSGDFVAGSHIPVSFSQKSHISKEELTNEIFKKHYSLWDLRKFRHYKPKFVSKIYNLIPEKSVYSNEEAVDLFECWDWSERQAKFICNSVRVYDFLDYEWRMPLWDNEIMEFWSRVKLENRIHRSLYMKYVQKTQRDIHRLLNEDYSKISPFHNYRRFLVDLVKKSDYLYDLVIKFIRLGQYNSHPLEWYGIVDRGYSRNAVLKGMESINSILVEDYISHIGCNKN